MEVHFFKKIVWMVFTDLLRIINTCISKYVPLFSPSLLNQQTLALAAASGLSLPAIAAALSGSGNTFGGSSGTAAIQNPVATATAVSNAAGLSAGLNPSAALLSALAGGNCSSQLGTGSAAAASVNNPNAALVAALMNSAGSNASTNALHGQSVRGGTELQNSSQNPATASQVSAGTHNATPGAVLGATSSQSQNYLQNFSSTHSLVGFPFLSLCFLMSG